MKHFQTSILWNTEYIMPQVATDHGLPLVAEDPTDHGFPRVSFEITTACHRPISHYPKNNHQYLLIWIININIITSLLAYWFIAYWWWFIGYCLFVFSFSRLLVCYFFVLWLVGFSAPGQPVASHGNPWQHETACHRLPQIGDRNGVRWCWGGGKYGKIMENHGKAWS